MPKSAPVVAIGTLIATSRGTSGNLAIAVDLLIVRDRAARLVTA